LLLALLCAAYLLTFWRRLLIQGLVPVDGDMMRLVFPTWSIGNRLFAETFLPLWDTYRNMGCPFLAHPPNQVLYPLHRLIPVSSFLDYLRLYVVGHALLAAVPSFLLARRWGFSPFAGALAALGVCCNGLVIARVTTTIDFASYAWAPLALYALSSRRPIALAFTLACQWFAGFPTFSLMTGLILAMAALADDDRRGAFRCLAIGAFTAAGLAAIQIIPFVELLSRSSRPVLLSADAAAQYSLAPQELLRPLLVPSLVLNRLAPVSGSDPAVIGFYLGPVLAALAVAAAAFGGRRERVFAAAALAFFILTLGSLLPFYRLIPGINVFRFPAHWLFPAVMLVAFLAAGVVDRLRSSAARGAVVALVALDLLIYAWPAHVAWAEPSFLEEKPRQLSLLGADMPAGRIFFDPPLIDSSSKWELRKPDDWVNLLRMGLPSIAAGYGAREVASRHQLPLRTHVAFVQRLAGLPVDDPAFDHAGASAIVRLSSAASVVPGPEAFTVSRNADLKAEAFFEGTGRVLLLRAEGEKVSAEVEGPGRLVLSQAWDSGWTVRIDGKEAPTVAFEAAFPSVRVPEGRHLVRFRYRPLSFILGASVSLLSLLFVLVLVTRRSVPMILAYASVRKGKTKNTGS